MKKILFILLCFSLFACNKEEKDTSLSEEEKKQMRDEISNILQGKWKFSRLAKDEQFTDLINITYTPGEEENNYILFQSSNYPDKNFTCRFYDKDIKKLY